MKLCECGCGGEVSKEGNRFINWHYSFCQTEEHRRKIGEAGKKRTATKETRLKIGASSKGRICSEETRKKLSIASKNQSLESRRMKGINSITHGAAGLLKKHYYYKKQECVFGCKNAKQYVLHHNPNFTVDNVRIWSGRLINICNSCHQKVHHGSLELPPNSGIEWTIEQTNEYFGV